MKPLSLLLIASLLANVALVAVYVVRSPEQGARSGLAAGPISGQARASAVAPSDALRAALASGNAAALAAAGLPPEIARELALGRTLSRIAERARAAQGKSAAEGRWWHPRGPAPGSREGQLLARRELSDALLAAFGSDFGFGGGDATQLSFLPAAKRDALRRINQDYDEMMAGFTSGGPQLASDKEKLRLLRAERERDIAALLSPDERLAYEMRTSASGTTVRNRYGSAIESEDEFQKIFALQKAFDDKFPREALTGRISPEVIRARSDAERQLESDLRATVGADRYAALRRAADPDLRTVDALASRLNLPPSVTDNVVATRDAFAAESQRISGDASVPLPQRRTQIQELASRAKSEVTRALGNEAADAYAQSSSWLNLLQNGMAYATTPQAAAPGSLMGGTQSIYPVMPAGVGGPGGSRQMFISATPSGEAGTAGDRVITNSNMQVMTFSTSEVHSAPAAGTSTPTIIVPAQPVAPSTRVVDPKP